MNYGKGRLTGMSDAGSSYTYTYDIYGNLEKEIKVIDGVTYTTAYTYDDAGNLESITYPDGRMVIYNRDAAGRISSVDYQTTDVSPVQTLATNISYRPFGPIENLTYGNGIQLTNTYDLNYQIDTIAAGSVMSLDYTPDAVGNVTDVTNVLDASRDQMFDYDDLYRLEDATGVLGNFNFVNNESGGFVGYDGVGNRLFKTVNSQTTAYSYNPGSNRLVETDTAGSLMEYSYDGTGKLKSTLTDTPGTAVQAEVEYTYNPNGQRIKKVVDGVTTIFHYDQFGNLIAETDGQGNPIKAYIYLHRVPLANVAGNPLSESIYYYHTDHLGTPQKMTDTAGTVVWAADYKPFGEVVVTVNIIENNFRFAGQYFDEETGLHYNYFRYYDPKTGRYLTPDPIGLEGGINLFTYVENNPVNLVDPNGLEVWNPNNYPISPEVQRSLDQFNTFIGEDRDIVITGGDRPADSNIGAGSSSTHTRGSAADIKVMGWSHIKTANKAADSGLFGGIGWYQEGYFDPKKGAGPHVHVDLRKGEARWGYDSSGRYYSRHFPGYKERRIMKPNNAKPCN